MKAMPRSTLVGALVLFLPGLALAQAGNKPAPPAAPTHVMVPAASVTFQPIEIPGFDPGVKIAGVHGDPNAASGMYVIRLSFPAGYKFPPHWHPMAENVTVLEGELLVAMGDKVDPAKLTGYTPGSFLFLPGKESHFGGARGATIIQLHGQAPFTIELTK
jgi:quercetin dioxygenase-like cupin family protein